MGRSAWPISVDVDASQGKGLLFGDATSHLEFGTPPLQADITVRSGLKLWLGILSKAKTDGVTLPPTDKGGVPAVLALNDLLSPSTAPAYTASFPKIGDNINVYVT